MADSIRDLFFGTPSRGAGRGDRARSARSTTWCCRERTLRALNHALALVRKHDLIFRQWGLAERHSTGPRPGVPLRRAARHRQDHLRRGAGLHARPEAAGGALLGAGVALGGADGQARGLGLPGRRAAGRGALLRRGRRDRRPAVHRHAGRGASARPTRWSTCCCTSWRPSPASSSSPPTSPPTWIPPSSGESAPTSSSRCPTWTARERIWRVQLHPRKTPLADDVDFRALAEALPAERRRHQERGAQSRADRHDRARPRRRPSGFTSVTSSRGWRR